jgi:hypothetical protein
MTRPLTFDHLRSQKKPVTKTIPVVLDPDLADEYETAKRARDVAAVRADARPADSELAFLLLEADQALEAVIARLEEEEAVVWFTFRGIGRAAYTALAGEHPPTAEQRAKARAMNSDATVNTDTFPPVLIAACLVDPPMTAEQAVGLWDDPNWNDAELGALYGAAIEVNGTRRNVDLLKKDLRPTRSSATKSPSP